MKIWFSCGRQIEEQHQREEQLRRELLLQQQTQQILEGQHHHKASIMPSRGSSSNGGGDSCIQLTTVTNTAHSSSPDNTVQIQHNMDHNHDFRTTCQRLIDLKQPWVCETYAANAHLIKRQQPDDQQRAKAIGVADQRHRARSTVQHQAIEAQQLQRNNDFLQQGNSSLSNCVAENSNTRGAVIVVPSANPKEKRGCSSDFVYLYSATSRPTQCNTKHVKCWYCCINLHTHQSARYYFCGKCSQVSTMQAGSDGTIMFVLP